MPHQHLTMDPHDTYVDRVNSLLAQGREQEVADLIAEFETELAHVTSPDSEQSPHRLSSAHSPRG